MSARRIQRPPPKHEARGDASDTHTAVSVASVEQRECEARCDESQHDNEELSALSYAQCGHFIDGLALPGSTHCSQPRMGAVGSRPRLASLLPRSLPVLTQPDVALGTVLLLPLVDCIYAHPASQSSLAATGTCCTQIPVEVLKSVDKHLHVILRWLREGCLEDSRPSLNCNAGVAVKDQVMAFYLSSRFIQTQPAPDPHHYTLWATASEYEWSERLIQPTFRRQQTTYKLAVQQSADMNEVMRGYESSVVDIINRLSLVLHADGLIQDNTSGVPAVRRILPMAYFEVGD